MGLWRVFDSIMREQAISEFLFASVSKRVFVRNHSNENDFDLHENGREKNRFKTETKGNSEMAY